jgi:signal transduction histidine kinase
MDRVDLAASVTKAVNDASFAARDKQITLQYTGPTEGCFVMGDDIAIHEVINNLLANAIKYTNSNGRVSVLLQQKPDGYSVAVSDNGIGIPKSAMSNLFTKFYRVKGGLNSGSTGTGLGLFIAKSIIERHNGTIDVASKEGVGSTFTFVLPALSSTANTEHVQKEVDNTLTTRRKRGWITKNITR